MYKLADGKCHNLAGNEKLDYVVILTNNSKKNSVFSPL